MRTTIIIAVLAAASMALAQTEEAACLASGGIRWDGTASPPRCTCPRGKVNGIRARMCDAENPKCDQCYPAGTRGDVRVVNRDREVVRLVREPAPPRPIVVSPHIEITPQIASQQPEGRVQVQVSVDLPGLERVIAFIQSEGGRCLLEGLDGTSYAKGYVGGEAQPPHSLVIASGKRGTCYLSVAAISDKGYAFAEGRYTFRGAPLWEGRPPVLGSKAKGMEEICELTCAQLRAVAHWNPDADPALRCEPLDPDHFLPGACAVVPAVVSPPLVEVDSDAACRHQCELDNQAHWKEDGLPQSRCEPRPEVASSHRAGPCALKPVPRESGCAELCAASGGTPGEGGSCICSEGQETSDCLCVARAAPAAERESFHIGLDGQVVTLISDHARMPVAFAPRLRLRFEPWERISLLLAGGPLVSGKGGETPDVPLGATVSLGSGLRLWSVWGGEFVTGISGDLYWVAIDRELDTAGVAVGGQFQFGLQWGRCFAGFGLGVAHFTPQTGGGAFLGSAGGGCELP